VVWAIAAWEVYKVTGDLEWLQQVYPTINCNKFGGCGTTRTFAAAMFYDVGRHMEALA